MCTNIGFLTDKRLMNKLDDPGEVKDLFLRSMSRLLRKQIPMLITAQAMDSFSKNRDLYVPLLGTVRLGLDEGISYMQGFLGSEGEPGPRVFVTDQEMPPVGILLLKDHLLVYLPGVQDQEERFIIFPKEVCPLVVDELRNVLNNRAIPLTGDILAGYLKALPFLEGRGIVSPWGRTAK